MPAANKGLWGALNCLMGRHVRSRGHAKAHPEGWVSRCGRCSIPMAKAHGGGKWKAIRYRRKRKGEPVDESSIGSALTDAIARSRRAGFRARHEKASEAYD